MTNEETRACTLPEGEHGPDDGIEHELENAIRKLLGVAPKFSHSVVKRLVMSKIKKLDAPDREIAIRAFCRAIEDSV